MTTEEELKKAMLQRKMEESMNQQQEEEMKKKIKEVMSKILEPKARERLTNLKLVKPQIAAQLELYLIQLFQSGQIKTITDEQLVSILKKLGEKRDIKITRK